MTATVELNQPQDAVLCVALRCLNDQCDLYLANIAGRSGRCEATSCPHSAVQRVIKNGNRICTGKHIGISGPNLAYLRSRGIVHDVLNVRVHHAWQGCNSVGVSARDFISDTAPKRCWSWLV